MRPKGTVPPTPFSAGSVTGLQELPGEERAAILDQLGGNGRSAWSRRCRLAMRRGSACRQRLAASLDVPLEIQFADDRALIAGIEVHFPHTVLRHTWRDDLTRALEELTADAHTLEHA